MPLSHPTQPLNFSSLYNEGACIRAAVLTWGGISFSCHSDKRCASFEQAIQLCEPLHWRLPTWRAVQKLVKFYITAKISILSLTAPLFSFPTRTPGKFCQALLRTCWMSGWTDSVTGMAGYESPALLHHRANNATAVLGWKRGGAGPRAQTPAVREASPGDLTHSIMIISTMLDRVL